MRTFNQFVEALITEKVMPQLDLLDSYNSLNKLYFQGELPNNFPIVWYKNKRLGGEVGLQVLKRTKEVVKINHLKISNTLKRSNEDIISILLHEMIHVWVAHKKLNDYGVMHGSIFMSKLKELNTRYNLKIPATEAIGKLDLADEYKDKTKEYIVSLYVNKENKAFVTLHNKSVSDPLAHYTKYKHHIEKRYKLLLVGVMPTNLYHTLSVKRTLKTFGGASAVEPHVFAEISAYFKENKNKIIIAIRGVT